KRWQPPKDTTGAHRQREFRRRQDDPSRALPGDSDYRLRLQTQTTDSEGGLVTLPVTESVTLPVTESVTLPVTESVTLPVTENTPPHSWDSRQQECIDLATQRW